MSEMELLGRIEALSKCVLHLTVMLEDAGCIDGPEFSTRLRGPDRPTDQVEYIRIARERLGSMADTLDAAREVRRCRPR